MTVCDSTGSAVELLAELADQGRTLAVAESLTGGLVAAELVEVPGASRVLRGGIIAYATDLKHALLGVDAGLLAEHGAVHPQVAAQMAQGVRERLGADVGLSTTGVAGPESQDGHTPGTVYIAVSSVQGDQVRALSLTGDRAAIRAASRDAVLALGLREARG